MGKPRGVIAARPRDLRERQLGERVLGVGFASLCDANGLVRVRERVRGVIRVQLRVREEPPSRRPRLRILGAVRGVHRLSRELCGALEVSVL